MILNEPCQITLRIDDKVSELECIQVERRLLDCCQREAEVADKYQPWIAIG